MLEYDWGRLFLGGRESLGAVWARWLSGLIGCEWVRQVEAGCLTYLNKPMINASTTPTPSLV